MSKKIKVSKEASKTNVSDAGAVPGPASGESGPDLYESKVTGPELAAEQAAALPMINDASRMSRRQQRGLGRLGRLNEKAARCVGRIKRLMVGVAEAERDHEAAWAVTGSSRRIRLPHWTPWIWAPLVAVLLWKIEQPFVNWLPGLILMSGTVAFFLAASLEAAAWWLGRSLAARAEAMHQIQLRASERMALRWAVPGVLCIQAALLVLRFLRTGQVASSIALTAGVLVLFGVSVFVHDLSTCSGEALLRHTARRRKSQSRQLAHAQGEYFGLEAKSHKTFIRFVSAAAHRCLTAVTEHITVVDALVRSRGGEPGQWPVSAALQAQIAFARGERPKELEFPPLPSSAGAELSSSPPSELPGGVGTGSGNAA